MFPPIVYVTVEVPTLEEAVQVYSASVVQTVKAPIVVRFEGSLFVTTRSVTLIVPSRIAPLPFSVNPLKAMSSFVFVRTAPSSIVKMPLAVRVDNADSVPLIVRSQNA